MDLGTILAKPAATAAAGFVAVVGSTLYRGAKHKQWQPHLVGVLAAFIGGASFPLALMLCLYPFFEKPPDLSGSAIYFPVSGLSLLYLTFVSVKQASRKDPDGNGNAAPPDA